MIIDPTSMKKSVRDLPDFKTPPLSEVSLSIQFAALTNLKGIHLGLFWKQFRKRYPIVSEQPPIQAAYETFGTPPVPRPMFQIQTFLSPPVPRYWFEKEGEPDLLQVQQDRIIHNWRVLDGATYPRYEKLRSRFEKEVSEFSDWLAAESLGEMLPNQCEVTYTNLIELEESDHVHADLSKLTPLWTDPISDEISSELEDVTINTRFVFSHNGKSAGRVYVQFQPVLRQSDFQPMIKLEITARGRPEHETKSAAFDFLDIEHREVVRTFAGVTTEEMQEIWGRIDARKRS
jgi:uncharacterized protein (TIGR04255 family)